MVDIITTDALTTVSTPKFENPHHNTRTIISDTHNASVSSYHHRPHPPTLAPSYLALMVDIGVPTEQ